MRIQIERFFVVLFVFCGTQSEAKSLGSVKAHKIAKRQLQSSVVWEDICPPPAFIEDIERKNCTDTCHSNDFCPGRQLCCENAGCRSCMNPVLPPAVIDWVGKPKQPAQPSNETDNEIHLTSPIYVEVECFYEGKSYEKGVFYKGCNKCYCNDGGAISCEVGPCKSLAVGKIISHVDKDRAPDYQGSGSAQGSSNDKTTAAPEHDQNANELQPVVQGESEQYHEVIAPKAEFISFDPPKLKHHKVDKESVGSGEGESGESEESGSSENSNGIDISNLRQRHSTEIKISRHVNELDELQKVGDIFLI